MIKLFWILNVRIKYMNKLKVIVASAMIVHSVVVMQDGNTLVRYLGAAESAFTQSRYKGAESFYIAAFKEPGFDQLDDKTRTRAQINYAETLLAQCNFKEGHKHFDVRLLNQDLKRKALQKPWDGTCQDEKCPSLLVRGEHGIGDT